MLFVTQKQALELLSEMITFWECGANNYSNHLEEECTVDSGNVTTEKFLFVRIIVHVGICSTLPKCHE